MWAIALPAVGTSLYFHSVAIKGTTLSPAALDAVPTSDASDVEGNGTKPAHDDGTKSNGNHHHDPQVAQGDARSPKTAVRLSKREQGRQAVGLLWHHFCESYSDPVVVQWSLWWALAMCGFTQVQMYIQFLWQLINPDHQNVWNGAVEATLTLLGAAGAVAAGYIESKRFEQLNLWVLTVCSASLGGLLLWSTLTDSVWVSYVGYVIFGMLTHFMVTLAR